MVDALDRYLAEAQKKFDVGSLIDPDVSKIESATYPFPTIYKYFARERDGFFSRPQLRFTQREALNDPFELSRRWEEVGAARLKAIMAPQMEKITQDVFSNGALLLEMVAECLAKQGTVVSDEQMRQAMAKLETADGKTVIEAVTSNARELMPLLLDQFFTSMEDDFSESMERVIADLGVLSLTEDPLHPQMWPHYASQGAGFVIGFDASHSFFLNEEGNNRKLRKVIYTDARIQSLWSNPYFLFLAKSAGWSYEREWRMFKKLRECDEQFSFQGQTVSVCNVALDAIKTVHFGYGATPNYIGSCVEALRSVGMQPSLYRVEANRQTGRFEEKPLGAR